MRTKINPSLPPKKIQRVSNKTQKIPAQKFNPPSPPPKKDKSKNKTKPAKRDLVPGHRHRTRILAWVCLKKECVHISAQRVPYFGTKCERCITFPCATKEIGHYYYTTRVPARRLFVPLMRNSDFNKTEQFVVSA